ncbi:MAG: deoxyhypusine synthase family protein, partial [Microcystaceae cyanobacterium]
PQIHEVLGLEERGHDYFVQFTDARPDTGGLSGATPSEAVSWGKIDPEELPSTIVCYTDSTIALPLVTAYALKQCQPCSLKRLYDKREQMLDKLRTDYLAAKTKSADEISVAQSTPSQEVATYPVGRLIPNTGGGD